MPQLMPCSTWNVLPVCTSSKTYQFVDVCTCCKTVSIEKSVCRSTQKPVMSQASAFCPEWQVESHVMPFGGSHSSPLTTAPSPHTGVHASSLQVKPFATRHSAQP